MGVGWLGCALLEDRVGRSLHRVLSGWGPRPRSCSAGGCVSGVHLEGVTAFQTLPPRCECGVAPGPLLTSTPALHWPLLEGFLPGTWRCKRAGPQHLPCPPSGALAFLSSSSPGPESRSPRPVPCAQAELGCLLPASVHVLSDVSLGPLRKSGLRGPVPSPRPLSSPPLRLTAHLSFFPREELALPARPGPRDRR